MNIRDTLKMTKSVFYKNWSMILIKLKVLKAKYLQYPDTSVVNSEVKIMSLKPHSHCTLVAENCQKIARVPSV